MAGFDDVSPSALRARGGVKWTLHPEGVLPAFVAEMDFAVAGVIAQALAAQLRASGYGYPSERIGGPGPVAEVFAERMRTRYGFHAEAGRVLLLADVVQGLFAGVQAFSGPQQGVVVQAPVYPPFFAAVRHQQRRVVSAPLAMGDGGAGLDVERLARSVDEHTRVLMLCNPQNPTGRVFTREELEALALVVLRHDLVVLADEIHADLVFDGRQHVPFATLSPEVAARTVTLTSASKAFNIPGLCCALAHFGSESLRRRFLELPHPMRGPASNPGIAATLAAWRHGDGWLRDLLAYLTGNRERVSAWARAHLPKGAYVAPEGTYLAWFDFSALGIEDAVAFFLEHAKVALGGGVPFGAAPSTARLAFATSRALLDELLERMSQALSRRTS